MTKAEFEKIAAEILMGCGDETFPLPPINEDKLAEMRRKLDEIKKERIKRDGSRKS